MVVVMMIMVMDGSNTMMMVIRVITRMVMDRYNDQIQDGNGTMTKS